MTDPDRKTNVTGWVSSWPICAYRVPVEIRVKADTACQVKLRLLQIRWFGYPIT
jgi:hypothetical protein